MFVCVNQLNEIPRGRSNPRNTFCSFINGSTGKQTNRKQTDTRNNRCKATADSLMAKGPDTSASTNTSLSLSLSLAVNGADDMVIMTFVLALFLPVHAKNGRGSCVTTQLLY